MSEDLRKTQGQAPVYKKPQEGYQSRDSHLGAPTGRFSQFKWIRRLIGDGEVVGSNPIETNFFFVLKKTNQPTKLFRHFLIFYIFFIFLNIFFLFFFYFLCASHASHASHGASHASHGASHASLPHTLEGPCVIMTANDQHLIINPKLNSYAIY